MEMKLKRTMLILYNTKAQVSINGSDNAQLAFTVIQVEPGMVVINLLNLDIFIHKYCLDTSKFRKFYDIFFRTGQYYFIHTNFHMHHVHILAMRNEIKETVATHGHSTSIYIS
jgi:uncharacterized protein (DUF849 family)